MFKRLVAVVFLAAVFTPCAEAEEVTLVEDRYVEEALKQAGTNRPELEKVLDHYAENGLKRSAARFLIANMPGKGYIVTELRDAEGNRVEYDPLSYPDFKAALEALEALEKKHGELDFARDHVVSDLETITAEFLIRHIDRSFGGWNAVPAKERVGFEAFLNFVLPYRGSQEPIDDWITPLQQRYAARVRKLGDSLTSAELYKWLSQDVHKRFRFNERYYLHPTDQGFTEMGRSGQGRCEDITNMITFAARSVAIATAADYTPAWAHRDNNHAWNVLLDANGRGFAKSNAHAAKVYRKTYAIQRACLAFQLPEGREAPNRFLKSTSYIDVTDQYAPTTDVTLTLSEGAAGGETFAYLCVFNGGKWVAIDWGRIGDGVVGFRSMGRNIVYLPAIHDGEKLIAVAPPLIIHKDGAVETLTGDGAESSVSLTSVSPKKKSPDTGVVTPKSFLKNGETYVLKRWTEGRWEPVSEFTAKDEPVAIDRLAVDGLYWLVKKESRRLERVFTIADGKQKFW